MYGKAFCKVYNEFGWNYFPEAFAQQLLLWMEEKNFKAKSCLDIGCGTGVLCGILAENGVQSMGVDLSESMIDIAKSRYPNCDFKIANMIEYLPEKPVDLVTCTGDALNHILNLDDIKKIFENVNKSLTPGGYFIADILNEKEIGNGEEIDLDYDENTKAKFTITADAEKNVCLRIAVYENGEFSFEEKITEKVHDPEIICKLLKEAGFDEITLGHKLLDEQDGQAITWFIVGRKGI